MKPNITLALVFVAACLNPDSHVSLETKYGPNHHKKVRSTAVNRINKLIDNQPERAPAISKVRSIELDDYIEMPTVESQPKLGKVKVEENNKIKGSAWSKMKEAKGSSSIQKQNPSLGPGHYQVMNQRGKLNSSPSSAFAFQGVRSFFDQIYYGTNQAIKAKLREQNKYKSNSIGPGSYNIHIKPEKVNKYQFFGSTEERDLS